MNVTFAIDWNQRLTDEEEQKMNIIKVGIGVLVTRDNRILLGHRVVKGKDTGGIYEPDSWCLPGGKQEYGETILEGAVREVKEETGLDIQNIKIFGAADDIAPDRHFVTIWVTAEACAGEAAVMEPDKQDQWQWFDPDELPDHMYSPSEKFIDAYLASVKNQ